MLMICKYTILKFAFALCYLLNTSCRVLYIFIIIYYLYIVCRNHIRGQLVNLDPATLKEREEQRKKELRYQVSCISS